MDVFMAYPEKIYSVGRRSRSMKQQRDRMRRTGGVLN